MKKQLLAVLFSLIAIMFVITGCGEDTTESNDTESNTGTNGAENGNTEEDAEAPVNIGVVFATGGLGDQSFNDNAYEGIERAKAELGVTYDYVEPNEIAEFETYHREYAKTGEYDLIVGIGFDQVDAISIVSEEFPEQKFLLIDSVLEADNVASAVFKAEEGAFLAGSIAAQQSESGTIGIVGGMDIPLINAFAAGYEAGAKFVKPDTEVLVNYVGAWNDPTIGKEMATSMYDSGADVVYAAAGGSGLGVFTAADEQGFMAIGADMEPSQGPDYLVATTVKKIDNVIFDQVSALIDGEWTAEVLNLGVKEEAVGYMVEGSNIETPQEYIDVAEDLKQQIIDGEIVVPTELDAVETFLTEHQ
ncbi:BMP family protein [Radiobacillus sp. PE A8.2]|uniref:BMP family lipoprotein n=1 Tax=Radiobacillus sp. PE A8.2 TaxID=3380349 RepID=UPI00388E5A19